MPRSPHGRLEWRDHVVVIGLQGTGKTQHVVELVRDARRVVFFDVKDEYASRLRGVRRVRPAELEDPEVLAPPRLRLAVLAGLEADVEVSAEFRYVVRKLRQSGAPPERGGLGRPGVVFVVEEVNLLAGRADATLRQLMANGHKDGIVDVLVSQRGVDAPLGCRAMVTRAYSFKQRLPQDLDRLRSEFGEDFAADAASWEAGDPPAYFEEERFYGWRR
jgi:hypothetical protein